ncbi:MAG: hypothetical protein KAX40_04505 [Herpetosiphon sp.]|nr:hypothetical protein [Herpetosiphon sp.]
MNLDVLPLIRNTLLQHSYDNTGSLPPSRLRTLAMQLNQVLTETNPLDIRKMGQTLAVQGLGVSSIFAVFKALQQFYVQRNDTTSLFEVFDRMQQVIEGYLEQKTLVYRTEQQRYRNLYQPETGETDE